MSIPCTVYQFDYRYYRVQSHFQSNFQRYYDVVMI